MKRLFRSATKRFQQRGSALLASLMVIVGLSLLGLAFVAISETESAISINERNHSQTVALAEAGARVVVQWFQNPVQMATTGGLGLMPDNFVAGPAPMTVFKNERTVQAYTGYYKASASELLCDLPFGPLDNDKFYGAEDTPDVIIDRSTPEGTTFLNNFNDKVFGPESATAPRPAGEITALLLYAPPIAGATLIPGAAPHWYVGGTRYGVATIMARAEKFDAPRSVATRRSLARAECRIVVSQYPLPTPGGPLQSATDLATNGNFNVHWGMVSAQQSLDLKKDYTTIPWFNAYEKIHFNRGYDSSVQWAQNTVYRNGDIVRPKTMNATLIGHEYTVTSVPAGGASTSTGTEPTWPVNAGGTVTMSGAPMTAGQSLTFTERPSTAYPLSFGGAMGQSNVPWLYYIARGNININDPWFHARSAQNIVGSPNANAQPYPFPYSNPSSYGATHHFQYQNFNQYPNFKQLIFPIINYDFWKAAAIAGNGQSGVKYLQWVAADTYTDGITTKTMVNWATSQPGYYFFDTQNAQNPQNGGPGVLAPSIKTGPLTGYLSSFIYLNAGFGTTGGGGGGPDGWFTQPGEPYMDIGFRQVEEGTGGTTPQGDFVRDAAGMPIITAAVNGLWDYQDLPWSNSGNPNGNSPGKNGEFDVFVAQRTVHDPSDTANPNSTYTGWFPVPYMPGCNPGNNSCAGCNCSEPHEPYLNVKYDGVSLTGLTIGWYDPSTAVTTMRLPKRTVNGLRAPQTAANKVTCTATSPSKDCTSNGYDIDGSLVPLNPLNDGVLFIEGTYDATGNYNYYGSVLVGQGGVNTKGTPILWYDESLSRGLRLPGFPRVMVTSVETDR
ncbi:MAG TPA: hypothetical protein VF980_05470 [Thermoanaerobaculia bacterium]